MKANDPSRRLSSWLERAWLTRYFERELDDDECAWFEAYVLDKPELIAEIERDTDLRDALAIEHDNRDAANDAAAPASMAPRTRSAATSRWVGLAATLVLGLGIGWTLHAPQRDDVVADPTRLMFDTMRGEVDGARVERAGSKSDWVLIEIGVPADATAISLTLDGGSAVSLAGPLEGHVSLAARRDAVMRARHAVLHYRSAGAEHSRELSLSLHESRPNGGTHEEHDR